MSTRDRDFFRPRPSATEYLLPIEQGAAVELVYGVLARACLRPSVTQPTPEEGVQTIELVPFSKDWDTFGLVAYPTQPELDPKLPEPAVSLQTCVSLPGTTLEFVNECMIQFWNGEYWASQVPLLLDSHDLSRHEMNGPRALAPVEVSRLNQWVNRLPARPAEI